MEAYTVELRIHTKVDSAIQNHFLKTYNKLEYVRKKVSGLICEALVLKLFELSHVQMSDFEVFLF